MLQLCRLEARAAALIETVCTKINWALVFPASRVIDWLLNRYFPLPGSREHVDRCARRKRRFDVLISLSVKVGNLGKPFRELQFFFFQRRDFLAYREQLLSDRLQLLGEVNDESR